MSKSMLDEKQSLISSIIPSEREQHTPAFTCGSPDFKYYAAQIHEQASYSGNIIRFTLFKVYVTA
jgi:hypothetical protein